jgi:hypothetical protein
MELEDIIRIRENNSSVTKTQVSKSGGPRKIFQSFKKSEDTPVDNDSFDSAGAEMRISIR